MVRSGTPEPAGGEQSLGDLVALAAKDVSQLVRSEISLAKSELRGDVRRVGLAAALGAVALFTVCLLLILLSIALAFGLVALGIWTWAAFLIVAGACLVLIAGAAGIAYLKVRKLSGLSKTRQSVTEGIGMLRREGKDGDPGKDSGNGVAGDAVTGGGVPAEVTAAADVAAVTDGQRNQIAGQKPR
ncbi:MAG TPA: phage holin family protein [Streptosporangiaceae bacterium]|jgi:hypothetical protein